MVDPFTLYAAVSAINGMVSLANAGLTRRHQSKMAQKSQAQRQEDLAYQTWMKYSIDRFGFSYRQGKFLKTILPNANAPIIIFDTVLKHHTISEKDRFPINPLIELESSFAKQNDQRLGGQCSVVGFAAGFRSQAEVLNFYNKELPNKEAIIVYADFDGTKLRVRAVYGGMTFDQFMIHSNGALKVANAQPRTIELCQIRYDLLLKELLPRDDNSKLSNLALIKGKVLIQKAIEFAAVTSLQSLIDCYFSLFDNDYKQKAGLIGIDFLEDFEEAQFTTEELLREVKFEHAQKTHNAFIEEQRLQLNKELSLHNNSKNSKGIIMLNAADIKRTFDEQLNKILTLKKRPTILVFGQVGVGKTTLIQKTLGKGIVPDDKISSYKPGTMEFIEYNDNYITLIDSQGFEPGMQVADFTKNIFSKVSKLQTNEDIKNHIHLAWYCIQGSGGRITKTDLHLIKNVLSEKRTMVVITKKDITKAEQLDGMIDYLVECGISRDKIVAVSELDMDEPGREELVNKSIKILPEAYKEAFISKQQVNLKYKKDNAKQIILHTAKMAGRWGMVPYFDWLAIVPLQLEMAAKLATNYGFDAKDIDKLLFGAGFAATIVGSVGANLIFDLINPVFGVLAGSVNAKATTGALGVFINDYFIEINEAIIKEGDLSVVQPLVFTKEKLVKAAEIFKESGI
jgi:predicted GTPase